jgi:hypothetical protein
MAVGFSQVTSVANGSGASSRVSRHRILAVLELETAGYLEFISSDPLIIYTYFNPSSYEAVLTINFNGMSSISVFYETSKQGNILLRPEINLRYINAGIVYIQGNFLGIQEYFNRMSNIKTLCNKWTGCQNFIGTIA